jgi:hypothetical protein
MTEHEWLQSTDLLQLLDYLPGRSSDRKLRLFACGCCRRIWPLLEDRGRRAVDVAERFADGLVSVHEFEEEKQASEAARGSMIVQNESVMGWAYSAACAALFDTPVWNDRAAVQAASRLATCATEAAWRGWSNRTVERERQAQVALLRDIVENPYRPGWAEGEWLTWNGSTVPRLAQGIYEERTFERLPILADALEEAGCQDQNILGHCRSGGEHVRGCWIVDLILGKT